MRIQQVIYSLITVLFTLNIFAQDLKQIDNYKFDLVVNNLNIEALLSKDWIKTRNKLNKNQAEFQVEYHFDDDQLFFIKLIKPDENINKIYEVKRIEKDGHGYVAIDSDYKIDFFFPREKDENEIIGVFTKNPDFTNDDQNIYLFEELYRNLKTYLAENAGTIAFFGDAVTKDKIEFLYYKFDNDNYSARNKIKIQDHSFNNYTKNYENSYRIDFDRKQLKSYNSIYFSTSFKNQKDTSIMNQNSINLLELRKQILATERKTAINNDIFLDQNFEDLIFTPKKLNQEEEKYTGKYSTKSSEKITFELRNDKIYYQKIGDLEYVGSWKLDEISAKKTISIYNIYTINRKIGNKSKPSDVGSSFDILINGERLLYPIALPAYTELLKL